MPSVIKLYKHVTPGTYSGLSCIVFVRQFSDQNVTASIFSGDLSLEASSAFANEAILEPLDGSLITSSISTVDRISEHRNVVAGTSGLAIRVTDLACRAIWLGYNQMFQVREHKIINSIAPHSVFAEVQKSGQSEADERWKLIRTRWLSVRHVPDVVNWEL